MSLLHLHLILLQCPAAPTTNDPFEHWTDMPEFDQPSQKPHATITVRVRNAEDLVELEKALGQKLTTKTKGVWFPELEPSGVGSKRWV